MELDQVPSCVKDQIVLEFYQQVCEMAERKMLTTGKLEGAHYASMKEILKKRGLIKD